MKNIVYMLVGILLLAGFAGCDEHDSFAKVFLLGFWGLALFGYGAVLAREEYENG